MPSVFLSHSSKDKDFVRELYRRLTRDGVDCFFDTESIGWGDNWVRVLERAIDECKYIVLVLSPDFCNSEWVQVERTSGIADDPSGLKRKVRPLLLLPCQELPTFPRFLRQIQMIDVSTATLFEANYEKICHGLGGTIVAEIGTLSRAALPPVHPLPERHRMPYYSLGDKFVGRVDALWQIYDALHRDSTTIIQGVGILAGTGGLGKSQTAIEYVHRFGGAYQGGAYWVDSDRGISTLISQVSEAARIAIDAKAEETEQLLQLWKGLNQMPPSLLVLDNFPEQIALRPYLPTTGRIHTLVTTRRRDLTNFPHVPINPLSTEPGIQLLNSGERQLEHADAAKIVERLGGLPLALELTKAYLNYRSDVTVQQVLAEMNASGEIGVLRDFTEHYRDELPSRHDLDVASTFQRSWELTSAAGKRVLRAMAELAPFPVPRAPLRKMAGFPDAIGLKDEFAESLSELSRLSLVEFDSASNPVTHRLIHAFIRYRNQVDQASPFEAVAAAILNEVSAANQNPDASQIRKLELLVPHAEALISSNQLQFNHLVILMTRLGIHYKTQGRYALARDLLAKALEQAEQSYEPGSSSIAVAQSNLGLVLQDLGQREQACKLLRNALASDEKSLPPGHSFIAKAQSNLALVLRDLGQLQEARTLLKEALASDEKTFQAGHPTIAIRQSNLSLVLKDLGQHEEALNLLKKALAADEKTFAPGHPSIALRQSNLATVLQSVGRLDEARDLLTEALASDTKTFEPGHPAIARAQSNLALVLRDLGRLEEARELLQQAVPSAEKTFPPGHPTIATMQANLAQVLQDLRQIESATLPPAPPPEPPPPAPPSDDEIPGQSGTR